MDLDDAVDANLLIVQQFRAAQYRRARNTLGSQTGEDFLGGPFGQFPAHQRVARHDVPRMIGDGSEPFIVYQIGPRESATYPLPFRIRYGTRRDVAVPCPEHEIESHLTVGRIRLVTDIAEP